MRLQRGATSLDPRADVDPPVDGRLGLTQEVAVVHRLRRCPTPLLTPAALAGLREAPHRVPVHRRLEQPRATGGEVGATVQHAVHLDVVGVAVAAVPVVADDDVGVLLVEHCREAGRGLVDRCRREGALVRVLLPPGHAGVLVAEPRDPVQPDRCRRRLGLAGAGDRPPSHPGPGPRGPRRGRRAWRRRRRRDGPRRRHEPSTRRSARPRRRGGRGGRRSWTSAHCAQPHRRPADRSPANPARPSEVPSVFGGPVTTACPGDLGGTMSSAGTVDPDRPEAVDHDTVPPARTGLLVLAGVLLALPVDRPDVGEQLQPRRTTAGRVPVLHLVPVPVGLPLTRRLTYAAYRHRPRRPAAPTDGRPRRRNRLGRGRRTSLRRRRAG